MDAVEPLSSTDTMTPERAGARRLEMLVLRRWLLLEHVLGRLVVKRPRPRLRALLMLGLAECWALRDTGQSAAQAVDFAVRSAARNLSKGESGMVNAVLRRGVDYRDTIENPALRASHPDWLVERWKGRWGDRVTHDLLRWNQQPSETYLHVEEGANLPPGQETEWPGFRRMTPGDWPVADDWLRKGRAYIQDPATRWAVALADVKPGEKVLDLCASPGGKTWMLAHALAGQGQLVALDRPGGRQKRLLANTECLRSRFPKLILKVQAADLIAGDHPGFGHSGWDLVLIDVPCSNTGVIRRKPDVLVRLKCDEFSTHAALQLQLLTAAARMLGDAGRLVYSTCSLEHEENEGVVESFLRQNPSFCLIRSYLSHPCRDGHDGGGAFLLTKGT